MTDAHILQYPEFSKPFLLKTDDSNFSIAGIVSQRPIGSDKPIAYISRTLNNSETPIVLLNGIAILTTKNCILAIVWTTKKFRPYLYGSKFKILTEQIPLNWLISLKEPNSRLLRWRYSTIRSNITSGNSRTRMGITEILSKYIEYIEQVARSSWELKCQI